MRIKNRNMSVINKAKEDIDNEGSTTLGITSMTWKFTFGYI